MSYELGGENAVPFLAHEADYVIRKSGSEYLAEGRLGNQDLHNDSFVALWDAIYGEVSTPVMQFARGTFTVDGVLGIQGIGTVVRGAGEGATRFEADTNLNDHIFEFDSGNFYYNALFSNFSIDGKKASQGGAGPYRGINADITAAATSGATRLSYMMRVENVTIEDCKGTGLYIKTASGTENNCEIFDGRFEESGGGGETVDVYIERMFDGKFFNNYLASMALNKAITTCKFGGNYYAGGAEAKVVRYYGSTAANPAHGNIHYGDFFDNPNNAGAADSGCLSIEDFSWNISFPSCTFGRNSDSSTANTASQVQITDDASHHKFPACTWYHPDALTRTFKYAIEEKDNADYNFYSGSISRLDRPNSGIAVYGTGYWAVAGNSDVDGLRVI